MIDKEVLDQILRSHKAQPVGDGYIDVIVKQENVRKLVEILIQNGVKITEICWWEYVDSWTAKSKYGLGGPKSRFYDGWFSEIWYGDDYITENSVEEIMKIIENKEYQFLDGESISYKQDNFLVPALFLDVPDEWKSPLDIRGKWKIPT